MHVAMALSQSPTIHISFFSYEIIAHHGARADRNEAFASSSMARYVFIVKAWSYRCKEHCVFKIVGSRLTDRFLTFPGTMSERCQQCLRCQKNVGLIRKIKTGKSDWLRAIPNPLGAGTRGGGCSSESGPPKPIRPQNGIFPVLR